MNGRPRYFPNRWKLIKDVPEHFFVPLTYLEFKDLKLDAWELSREFCCIIRVTKTDKSKKTKEFVYQRQHAARAKVQKLLRTDGIDFTVCTPESLAFYTHAPNAEDYEPDSNWNDEGEDFPSFA